MTMSFRNWQSWLHFRICDRQRWFWQSVEGHAQEVGQTVCYEGNAQGQSHHQEERPLGHERKEVFVLVVSSVSAFYSKLLTPFVDKSWIWTTRLRTVKTCFWLSTWWLGVTSGTTWPNTKSSAKNSRGSSLPACWEHLNTYIKRVSFTETSNLKTWFSTPMDILKSQIWVLPECGTLTTPRILQVPLAIWPPRLCVSSLMEWLWTTSLWVSSATSACLADDRTLEEIEEKSGNTF